MTLEQQVRAYYDTMPSNGRGGRLSIVQLEEVLPGIIAVLDTLGEVDLFLDPTQHAVNKDAPSPYRLFVEVVEEALNHTTFFEKHGFIGVVEDRWHPLFARRSATIELAKEAAQILFIPR